MKVYRGYQQFTGGSNANIIAIGNFDGVHLGHQRVIEVARQEATRQKGELFVFTFDPHPVKILAPPKAPPLLTTLQGKLQQFARLGVDHVIVQPFDTEFAQISPAAFVEHILIERLAAVAIVVGYDFTFGQRRVGTFEVLQAIAQPHHVLATRVEAFQVDGVTASSSKIRGSLLEGDPRSAALLLGRPFSLSGAVVHGQARGRTIGFPTANVQPQEELIPARGVYACLVTIEGDDRVYGAATNVGAAPTFANQTVTIEAHLLDTQQDLYGKILTVAFIERIRAEQRFSGIDELQKQIAHDIETTRNILARREPDGRTQ
jgi:riboflavin kinase / FMN adenylyltransferase